MWGASRFSSSFLESALHGPMQFCGKCTKCHLDHQDDWGVAHSVRGGCPGHVDAPPLRLNTLARLASTWHFSVQAKLPRKIIVLMAQQKTSGGPQTRKFRSPRVSGHICPKQEASFQENCVHLTKQIRHSTYPLGDGVFGR